MMEWLLTHVPVQVLASVMIGLIIVFSIGVVLGRYLWLDRVRPPSDMEHLRTFLEREGARIEWIKPDGVVIRGRSGPNFRRYRASVAETNGTETSHVIDVEAVLFGRPQVRDISQRNHIRFKDG
jgi:hypothetical protein